MTMTETFELPAEPDMMTDQEFGLFRKLLYQIAGIDLSLAKKPLVYGRLARRLNHHALASFADYYQLLMSEASKAELQIAVDLLTTNETYFFREPKHFDFLRQRATAAGARAGNTFRVWSAACSTGEEPYSIAMVLDECRGPLPWELIASDISARVLEKARVGHYAMDRIDGLPARYLQQYCLKGIGHQAGTLLVERKLRSRVNFMQINLNSPPPAIGQFDLIFLRNVMIYFDIDTKRRVIGHLLPHLKADGALLVGHAETLGGVTDSLAVISPSLYRRA